MKHISIYIALIFCFYNCNAQKIAIGESKDFDSILTEYSLKLDVKELKNIPVNKNSNVKYQYAVKHDTLDFEIRFLITDINQALNLPQDKRSLSLFTSKVINASGSVLPSIPKIQEFGSKTAKQEYNADWLATSSFTTTSNFTSNFKYCSVIALRKNEVGEAYMFFLFNDKKIGAILTSEFSTCLKFN